MEKLKILSLKFNEDIISIIKKHYFSLIIQSYFRNNRPLSLFTNGDRVYYLKNNKKCYGSYVSESFNFIYFQPLPQIIPLWKKSNLGFWNEFSSNFPYFIPNIKIINKNKIFKLNSWNSELIYYIDNKERLKYYFNKT